MRRFYKDLLIATVSSLRGVSKCHRLRLHRGGLTHLANVGDCKSQGPPKMLFMYEMRIKRVHRNDCCLQCLPRQPSACPS